MIAAFTANVLTSKHLFRQLRTRLLRHQVRGIPVGPILVALPGAPFMLAVCGLRTSKRARQIAYRCVRRVAGDTAWQPRRDLLKQPGVAIRITERGERKVATVFRIRSADATARERLAFQRGTRR